MDVQYVAALARIALTSEEATELQGQLDHILDYVAELKKLDVSHIEPTAFAIREENVWREDEPRTGLTVEQVLENAPAARNGLFVVPKVLE